jgi:hypothetical protein
MVSIAFTLEYRPAAIALWAEVIGAGRYDDSMTGETAGVMDAGSRAPFLNIIIVVGAICLAIHGQIIPGLGVNVPVHTPFAASGVIPDITGIGGPYRFEVFLVAIDCANGTYIIITVATAGCSTGIPVVACLISAAMRCCEGPVVPRIVHAVKGKVAGTSGIVGQFVLDLVRSREGLGVIVAGCRSPGPRRFG